MNIRDKLADWISGGKITYSLSRLDAYKSATLHARKNVEEHREREIAAHSMALEYLSRADGYRDALSHIVSISTPKMAHVGKRMAKVALEALE